MPSLAPRNLLAVLLRRTTASVQILRSRVLCRYVMLAYPQITIERGAMLDFGARLRAYDGGTMVIGAGTSIGRGTLLVADGAALEIGARGFVGEGSIIIAAAGIRIGVDSLIAEGVTIRDQDHPVSASPRNRERVHAVPITIGHNVWIGAKASILKGVAVGDDCVVGAHAVVTRDVPAQSVALGIPAVVRRRVDHQSNTSTHDGAATVRGD